MSVLTVSIPQTINPLSKRLNPALIGYTAAIQLQCNLAGGSYGTN